MAKPHPDERTPAEKTEAARQLREQLEKEIRTEPGKPPENK